MMAISKLIIIDDQTSTGCRMDIVKAPWDAGSFVNFSQKLLNRFCNRVSPIEGPNQARLF